MLRSFRRMNWIAKGTPQRKLRPRTQLRLQTLEGRAVPALFNVTTLADSGAGSLREAINLANDETANPGLDTITFSVNGTITLASNLTITSDININGPGASKIIIDGNNANQILTILGTGTTAVSLSGVTLTKGKAIGFTGGAIGADSASLTLTNVTVSNSFSDLAGGGVFVNEGGLTVTGSTITGNTVESDLNNQYGGGIAAIASVGTFNVSISDSTISNNTVKSTTSTTLRGIGAGLLLDTTAGASHTLTNVTISGNVGKGGFGGGVYSFGGALTVNNCTISNNQQNANGTLGTTGGGIDYNGSQPLVINDSTFFNNFANGNGGALFLPTADVTVNRTTFEQNKANSAGGTIWAPTTTGKTITFQDCAFINNSTGNSGGVFSASGDALGANINFINSTFTGNTAAGNGGVSRTFGNFNGTINVIGVTATNNTANNNNGGGGFSLSGLAGTPPTMNIKSSIIAENIAGGSNKNTGADISRAVGTINIEFTLIGVYPTTTTGIVETVPGSNLKGSTTTPLPPDLLPLANYGGSTRTRVPNSTSPVINKGSNPLSLPNDQRGPGFTRTFGGTADMGAVEANRPAPTVAAVNAPNVVTAGGTTYTFSITFQDDNGINVATLSTAGAVTVSGGNYAVPEVAVFKSVDIPTDGTPRTATFEVAAPGGTFDLADNGTYNINIVGNKIFDIDIPTPLAVNAGVAGKFNVALPQNFVVDEASDIDDGLIGPGQLSLREAIQLANKATGFDSVTFSPTVFASDTTITFTDNRIAISDSVKLIGPSSKLTLVANPVVSANSFHFIVDGFGTLNVEISNLTLINGNRDSNAFGANGGSIGNSDENLTITNCTFENNTSWLDGGAVGMSGKGNLSIVNSKFIGNFTKVANGFSGGAVSAAAGTVTITGCEFENNNADGVGGAVVAQNTDSVTITNSKFTGNKSQAASSAGGGAMFFSNNAVIAISGCQFTLNEQSTSGAAGAISFSVGTSTVTIDNTSFIDNKSIGGSGGAIWTRNDFTGTIVLNNVTMTGNEAGVNGGAIRVGGNATITVNNSTLSGNKAVSALGGGIIMEAGGSLTVNGSTLSGNMAANGGGIYAKGGTGAALLVSNSTLSGNIASNDGGGILISAFTTNTATIRNSTLTLNDAQFGFNGGGGIAIIGTTGTVTLASSIVAQNLVTGGGDNRDIVSDAPITLAGKNNVIGVGDKGNVTYDPANQLGTLASPLDAKLAPLALNGAPAGSPLTHAITTLSPAFNMGNNDAGLTTDQRGAGFKRTSGGGTDAGAFELQLAVPPQVVDVIVNNGAAQRSLVTSLKVTFDEAVTLSGTPFILTRYANGTVGTIGLVINQVGGDVTLTFNNTGSITLDPGGSLPDGTYELTIVADNVMGTAGKLDGNKNGISEGSPIDNVTSKLHRLFGDANGDGAVTASDFAAFRLDYGSPGPSIFDFDGVGGVTAGDFNNFRLRYGLAGYQP